MEKLSRERLSLWSRQSSIELKDMISAMIFDLTTKKLIGYDASSESEDLRSNFASFIAGLISFPVNVPGTAFHKCLQGRKNAMKVLKRILAERMKSPTKECKDFFDCIVEELNREKPVLTVAVALDLIFVLLFASFETTSLALTLAVKLLTDHPKVLEKLKGICTLQEEHDGIIMSRENPDSGITWKEYKSMSFTFQVINETVRLANIVPGIFRKTLKDVQINGYTIPAGWGIMVCPPAVHLNPEIYKDPLTFNPWRWKDKPELSGGTKHFMVFGGGMRFCVGSDFSKLQMAVFLHCLVTKYSLLSLWIFDDEMLALAALFEFSLIGKFTGRRPPIDLIQKIFFQLKLIANPPAPNAANVGSLVEVSGQKIVDNLERAHADDDVLAQMCDDVNDTKHLGALACSGDVGDGGNDLLNSHRGEIASLILAVETPVGVISKSCNEILNVRNKGLWDVNMVANEVSSPSVDSLATSVEALSPSIEGPVGFEPLVYVPIAIISSNALKAHLGVRPRENTMKQIDWLDGLPSSHCEIGEEEVNEQDTSFHDLYDLNVVVFVGVVPLVIVGFVSWCVVDSWCRHSGLMGGWFFLLVFVYVFLSFACASMVAMDFWSCGC
ncbi:hypothetical protein M5K25_016563 [Dendrobium thyrsiflorum]|uniref:Cytochrome P450 n=1 Tax=Dendrobium thyrsiflorum TaxID=117978 RepID=A0ABD0UK15_DENTH